MQFSMFNKGNLERRYTYIGDDNEPAMCINNHATKSTAFVELRAAYKYNEPAGTDQADMIEAFNLLRKVDQTALLEKVQDATVYALLKIGSEDLTFGIALGLFRMAVHLGISLDDSSLLRFREYIADGLDDLVKMPPFKKQEKKVVGEYEATVDGTKLTGELTE